MQKPDMEGKFVQYCRWNEIVLYKQECAACTVHRPDAFESYKGRAAFARLIPDTRECHQNIGTAVAAYTLATL